MVKMNIENTPITDRSQTPEDYGYDTRKIAEQATENLGRNKEYRKLLDKYDQAVKRREYATAITLNGRINEMKTNEVQRLVALEEEKRESVHAIAAMLERIDKTEHDKYMDLMSGMCFLLDMLEITIIDINDLLVRNNIGVKMGQFHEVTAVKDMASELAGQETKAMPEYQRKEWEEETDRLYSHLQERAAVYRRKVERLEAKMKKTKSNC